MNKQQKQIRRWNSPPIPIIQGHRWIEPPILPKPKPLLVQVLEAERMLLARCAQVYGEGNAHLRLRGMMVREATMDLGLWVGKQSYILEQRRKALEVAKKKEA